MKKLLAFLFALGAVLPAAEIEIGAERFTELNGWTAETGLICSNQKGDTAKVTFDAAEAGDYVMWVRTRNHGENWRKTEIFLNGKSIGEFGDAYGYRQKSPGWGWSRSRVKLVAGKNTLKLVAAGGKCRLAQIIFTTDKAYRPETLTVTKMTVPAAKKGKSGNGAMVPDGIHLPIDMALEIPRRPQGRKGGPSLLMLGGGRPWMTNGLAKKLCAAGADLYLLNGFYLGGLSGASIKQTPQQSVEPKPHDYISHEFKQLKHYKAIYISAISEINQSKLFTPERVRQLKEYVEQGGNLVMTVNTPEELFELCPVMLGDKDTCGEALFATRPEGARYTLLPEKWGSFDPFRECGEVKKDAKVLSYLVNAKGDKVAPFAVIGKYGKGNVLFFNDDYDRRMGTTQFFNWTYAPTLVAALISEAGGFELDLAKTLPDTPTPIPSKICDRADVEITLPAMKLEKVSADVTIDGTTAVFSNGYKIQVNDDTIDIIYPGQTEPYLKGMKFPKIAYPASSEKVDDFATAEATNVKTQNRISRDKLKVAGMKGGKSLVITLQGEKGTLLDWEFVSGTADIDGRIFNGIGDRLMIREIGEKLLNQVDFNYQIDVDNVRFRRFACYAGPRGYAEYDLSGKVPVKTNSWGFFANGQPFSWTEGKKGVFAEFLDEVYPIDLEYSMKKGDKALSARVSYQFGRVKVPQTTAVFWHMATDAKYNTSNDWIAMYQFQRHNLRQKAGFPEIPAAPVATYANTCTDRDRTASLQAAREFGFETIYLNLCPSAIESYESPKVLELLQLIKKMGFGAYPWHPCCHTPGDSPSVHAHPEWYVHDENGKISGYFGGHYRIADMSDKGFLAWYMPMLDKMIDAGAVTCWYDMGGAASRTYNFAGEQSPVGLWPQLKIYKHWYDRGGFVITEGMNPLVKDGYLFFIDRYTPPYYGREFAFVGANCSGTDWWYMDFFRTSMYGTFFDVVIDAWPSKFESRPGQLKELARIRKYLPTVQRALKNGMPFIRETPFGTTWTAEKGAAIFCFDGVQNLNVSLPENFVPVSMTLADGTTVSLDGKMPQSVAPQTIILIEKR
ncbi:MAG: hypothetical protein MJ033_05870 [Victivallaceae bacterium]|nr:hypothetical protein [Victivallaceae bacterium]